MDVFVSRLPFQTTDLDLLDAVHPQIDFIAQRFAILNPNWNARVWTSRSLNGSKRKLAVLTFGSELLGRQFVAANSPSSNIRIGQTMPDFRISNKPPDPSLVNHLRTTTFIHPVELRRKRKQQEKLREPIELASVEFGRFDDEDGTFSPELEVPEDHQKATIWLDSESRLLHLQFLYPEKTLNLSVHFSSINFRETVGRPPRAIIITLSQPPKIEQRQTKSASSDDPMCFNNFRDLLAAVVGEGLNSESTSSIRLSSITSTSSDTFPFVACTLLVTFPSTSQLSEFKNRKSGVRLPKIKDTGVKVERRGLCAEYVVAQLAARMRSLDFRVAYQVALILHNQLLSPHQLLELLPDVAKLCETRVPEEVELILHKFSFRLVDSIRDLGEDEAEDDDNFGDEGGLAPRPFDELVRQRGQGPSHRWTRKLSALRTQLDKIANAPTHRKHPSNFYADPSSLCRHVVITPTSFRLEGPVPDQSNSILRRYRKNSENFLRVSVRDEDLEKFRYDNQGDVGKFLKDRYLPFFRSLEVAGREFEFLGYSTSALRECACWFVSPFEHEGQNITADSIRSSLGDFTHVNTIPAKFFARIAQAFTSTQPSVSLHPEEVRSMPDIKASFADKGETIFTDGVGIISPDLADEIERVLNVGKPHSQRKRRVKPTTYQIRIGGAKGVVAVDPRLNNSGRLIYLRPSMEKYVASSALSITLDIAQTFSRPLPAFLNRPLIQVLENLGVQASVFMDLQSDAVSEIEGSLEDSCSAASLVERMGFTTSLHRILRRLDSLGVDPLGDLFLQTCIEIAVTLALRDIKHKARVPLPGCYTLVGIADEDGILEEGEIYAAIEQEGKDIVYLEGPVCISRSPVIHPGDVQMVRAVGRLPPHRAPFASYQKNSVIFSVKGTRSLPSCLGGGDLDGDIYVVIPNKELHPPKLKVPAAYEAASPLCLGRPCTAEDGASFFLEYILADVTGMVATRHLKIADQDPEGPSSANCLKLAQFHSHAVDFAKTGRPVNSKELPLASKTSPDFTCPAFRTNALTKDYYPSPKVLGELYRSVPSEKIRPSFGTSVSTKKLDEQGTLTRALSRLQVCSEPLGQPDAALVCQFSSSIETFSEELLQICRLCNLSQRADRHLSEEEAFSSTIFFASRDVRKRQDLIARLRHHTSILFEDLLNEICGESEDEEENPRRILDRAWGAWGAAISADQTTFGARTFGFLALEIVLDQMKELS
ncbi:RdRP-domain-containing protein [Meredithblackwellia eburnea MCA 4105]